MKQFINIKAVKLFFYTVVYLTVFFVAEKIYFDKGDVIFRLSALLLPLFFVNGLIPFNYKHLIFPLLFFTISVYVFSVTNAFVIFILLFVVAMVFISSLGWIVKLLFSLMFFTGFYLLQNGTIQLGSINLIVPFLAPVLMFRCIILLYEQKFETVVKNKNSTLAYFFSFPQLFFPIMPIVDHKHFNNGFNEKEEFVKYDKAITQFVTGIFLFCIYKIINQIFSPSLYDIENLYDLMLYIISKSIILLKLCGIFIFSIGFLSMFGVDLPSSFGFFPLAASFRDYWKDVNRFWRDFILKIVYYPLFFRLRKTNFSGKGILLIVITFMSSCFFHFYQLYWATGYCKFKMTDVLYWFLLGLLVFYSGYRFERSMKQPIQKESLAVIFLKRSLSVLFVQVVMNFLFFVWTIESMTEVIFLMKQGRFTINSLYLLMIYWLIFCIGIVIKDLITKHNEAQAKIVSVFKFGFIILILSLYGLHISGKTNYTAYLFKTERLTVNQLESNEEGYYSRLMSSNSNSKMGKEHNNRMSPLSKISFTSNTVLRQELMPSRSVDFNGTVISINKFGLRDREYNIQRTPGVNRVAILGASYEMGTGVNNNEVFEEITEDWLNKYSGKKYELLNFGVPAYTLIQNEYVMEHKVVLFKPDKILLFSHTGEEQRLANNITRLIKEGFNFKDDFINFIIDKGGIQREMCDTEIKYRLKPFMNELFSYLYKKIIAVCRSNNIGAAWVFLPTTNALISDSKTINNLRDIARESGFETFSLRKIYSNYDKEDIRVSYVDPHPNALGHVLIAGGVYKIISEPKNTTIYE